MTSSDLLAWQRINFMANHKRKQDKPEPVTEPEPFNELPDEVDEPEPQTVTTTTLGPELIMEIPEEFAVQVQPVVKLPLRIGEIVNYVSKTPYGNSYLKAVVMSDHRDHVGLRVFCDSSGGSEWPVNSRESEGREPGTFFRGEMVVY